MSTYLRHTTLGWLLLIIPVVCIIGFFLILYLRPQNFYGPSDFSSDYNYLSLFKGFNIIPEGIVAKVTKGRNKDSKHYIQELVSHLPMSFCFFLLKTADKPSTMLELLKTLAQEMNLPRGPNTPTSTSAQIELVSGIGFYLFAVELSYKTIFFLSKDDDIITLKLCDGVRDLLSMRIAIK